jgi:type IX secretion system PorP/SprF family membrane protein
MKKIIYILFFALSFSMAKAQQDPQYSQYMFNHVVINPGYTGSKDALSTTLQMRKQWVGIDGSPQTNDFSIHGPLKSKNIGVGGHVVLEQIGPKRWASAYGDFAYHIKVGKGKLRFRYKCGYDFLQI